MSPEVRRGLGNERDGGYEFRAKAPCLSGDLSDIEALQRFLDHRAKRCPCTIHFKERAA